VIRQRTIRDTVRLEGVGLQTGEKVSLTLKNSPADSGINFLRVDLPGNQSLNIRSFKLGGSDAEGRRTILNRGDIKIHTTEHFLAALSGLSIDNIRVEMEGPELPGLDGSAREFVRLLKKAGVKEQEAPRRFLAIREPVRLEGKGSVLAAFPSDVLRISYTLSYDDPVLGDQFFDIILDEGGFEREIAPARTFCRKKETLMLLASGLGKGANYKNTLVMGKRGPFRNKLRFPDEPVRHKILDLIGDLYLLGVPLKAHIIAIKSGHKLNMELVKVLRKIEGEPHGQRSA
jgi:UDP-3-O-[3-hydroxymyristoyl] N-acetylglucosamine deacetylase/3-hydroxyacyl-[acyl-carrier-protein] dehydratase